jgi:hypothetical protein
VADVTHVASRTTFPRLHNVLKIEVGNQAEIVGVIAQAFN